MRASASPSLPPLPPPSFMDEYGVVAGTGIALVIAGLVAKKLLFSKKEEYRVPEGSNLIHEPILDLELKMFVEANEPPISSVTFFDGDAVAATATLRKRCKLVFEANPWMAGKVGKPNKDAPMSIISPPASNITDKLIEEYVLLNPEGIKMNEEMPYDELMTQTLSGGVGVAYAGTLWVPMFRITIVDSGNKRFCMTVTMNHILGDGFTYYSILNQICSNEKETPKIKSLNPKRDLAAIKGCQTAAAPGFDYFPSPGFIINMISTLKFGSKMRASAYYLDDEKVKVFKAKAKEDGAKFVSTNDIVTSSWGAATNTRLVAMAINLRGRVENVDDTMAGNYENLLWFDSDTLKSPAKVRQVMSTPKGTPFKGCEKPMPGFFELCRSRNTLITSWAAFGGEFKIDGCKQGLHMPCYELARLPFDIAIVFIPKPGKTGMMYFSRDFGDKEFKKMAADGLMPLGEPISPTIFPPS